MEYKTCTGCLRRKKIDSFRWIASKNKYLAECLICESDRKREYKSRNREALDAKDKIWRANNRDRLRANQERWKANNPGLAAKRAAEWYEANKKYVRTRERENYRSLKKTVYDHYGHVCNCCGETHPMFLSIDHVNNDGNRRRRKFGYGHGSQAGGAKLYRVIIAEGFPDTYQILCMMCNWGKARNGGTCPHKDNEGSETRAQARRAKRPEARSPASAGEDIVRSTP